MELDLICFEPPFVFDAASMQQFAEAPNALTVIARDEENLLAGFAIVHLEDAGTKRYGYIVTIDVAVPYRRKGLAGRLMEHLEDQAARAGAAWMDLHVLTQNDTAVRFYEARGYLMQGTQRGFYGPRLHALRYRKELQRAR